MPETQSFKDHARWDPAYHFVLAPILVANFIFSITSTIRHWPMDTGLHLWGIVMSVALLIIGAKVRTNPLGAQDRTIRLEERLRFATLLSPAELAASASLTMKQYVALRFASDAEVPALVSRTLAESLAPKQIKQSIVSWRPDNDRV